MCFSHGKQTTYSIYFVHNKYLKEGDIKMESMSNENKLSLAQKISYGGGNLAANLMVTTASSYITYFYTDIAQISVGAIGVILLLCRLLDGISDLAMGYVVDKVNPKHGKARSWLRWLAFPYGISIILLFSAPDLSMTGKTVYAGITYLIALAIIYTAISVPYNTLSMLATKDPVERTSLSTFRTFMGYAGALLVSTFTLIFVDLAGGGKIGWMLVGCGYGLMGAILYLLCYRNVKELPVDGMDSNIVNEKTSVKDALRSLFHNKYWILVILITVINFLGAGLNGGMVFYAEYILGNSNLVGGLSFAYFLPIILSSFFVPQIVARIGKRNMVVIGSLICTISQIIIIFNRTNYMVALIGCAIRGIGSAPVMVSIFAMIGDAAEYGYLKDGIRAEGMAFSAVGFSEKVGSGIGGVILTTILSLGGYVGGAAVQTETALTAIMACFAYIPLILFVIPLFVLPFYKLDKEYPEMLKKAGMK